MNDRKVYSYRSPAGLAIPAFICVWVGFVVFFFVSAKGNVEVNGHPATSQDLLQFQLIFGGVSVFLVLILPRILIGWFNERIIVDNGQITWIDWLGRTRAKGSLATLNGLREISPGSQFQRLVFDTDGGEVKFNARITDFANLRDLVMTHGAGVVPSAKGSEEMHQVEQQIPFQTFAYRWGYTHLFSFPLLALVLFMAAAPVVAIAQHMQIEPPPTAGSLALWYLVIGGFFCLVMWMQLQGWNERIELGPDGIQWIGCMGNVRVSARLDEIQDFQHDTTYTRSGTVTKLSILTKEGPIRCSSYMRGYQDLANAMTQLTSARDQMLKSS